MKKLTIEVSDTDLDDYEAFEMKARQYRRALYLIQDELQMWYKYSTDGKKSAEEAWKSFLNILWSSGLRIEDIR